MHRTRASARGRVAAFAALGLLLAACTHAAVASTSAKSSSTSTHTSASAMSLSTDSVKGLGTVLGTSKGLTLYHNTQETNGTIVCTGTCAATWRPLIIHGALPHLSGVIGSFGTVKRPDGTTQLTFEGMPLYTYAGDTAPGQASGQGLQGIWFAIGPRGIIKTMSSGGAGSSSTGASSSSGGGSGSGTSSNSGGSGSGGGGTSSWG